MDGVYVHQPFVLQCLSTPFCPLCLFISLLVGALFLVKSSFLTLRQIYFYSALFYGEVDLFGFEARVDSFNVVALM